MTDQTQQAASQWRKKPVVIHAVQYTESVRDAHLFDDAPLPEGVFIPATHIHRGDRKVWRAEAYIQTLEGRMEVSIGDWVITGIKGEHYPCKPDIFSATYEPADAPAAPAVGAPVADVFAWTNGSDIEIGMRKIWMGSAWKPLYLAPTAASLREQEWDYEPQLTAIEHGSEPSLRRIIKHYYRSNGIASAKADKLTAQYIDAQRLGREKEQG